MRGNQSRVQLHPPLCSKAKPLCPELSTSNDTGKESSGAEGEKWQSRDVIMYQLQGGVCNLAS